jgi:hypothetical protein
MIRYQISSGVLSKGADLLGVGYSGQPQCKNDPDKCSEHNAGPIPPGIYSIQAPVDTKTHGPYVMWLTPDPKNEMFGRSAFGIHGDSVVHPGTASEGCIIMPRSVREAVYKNADLELEVIP